MKTKHNNRRHERNSSFNRPVSLKAENGTTLCLLPTDESESGIGCIFTGNNPPEKGTNFKMKEKTGDKLVIVRWVNMLTENIYKLGFEFV